MKKYLILLFAVLSLASCEQKEEIVNARWVSFNIRNDNPADSLNNWVQDLLAYATQQALDGKLWPGYKLVAGRSNRKYSSEAEVIKAATDAGYTDIYKTSLLGVGDLEKRMGRKALSHGFFI